MKATNFAIVQFGFGHKQYRLADVEVKAIEQVLGIDLDEVTNEENEETDE